MHFRVAQIPLAEICWGDHTFRITTPETHTDLSASIASMGIINLPYLLDLTHGAYRIVAGFRRLETWRAAGHQQVLARITHASTTELECARLAVADNALQRPLNLMEEARASNLLIKMTATADQLATVAKETGLNPNPGHLNRMARLCALPDRVQEAILAGSIGFAMAETLAEMDTQWAVALADLFCKIPMSLSRQREIISLVLEIAQRDDLTPIGVIQADGFQKIILHETWDNAKKATHLRRYLRRLRFPNLTAWEAAFQAELTELALGPHLRLTPPRDFEGTVYQFNLAFQNLSQLESACNQLRTLARHPALKRILNRKATPHP